MSKLLYLSVNVPENHADEVREALGKAGAGKIGDYSYNSFSIKGMGRSKAKAGADPTIGEVGQYSEMAEEKIETTCTREQLPEIVKAVTAVHPYEKPVIIVYEIEMVD